MKLPSVNAEMIPLSDHKSMEQMGKVLWQLVTMVAGIKNDHTLLYLQNGTLMMDFGIW